MLVGCDDRSKLNCLYDLINKKFLLSKDVVFDKMRVGHKHVAPANHLQSTSIDHFHVAAKTFKSQHIAEQQIQ